METAEANFRTKRYIYAIFMCHLSIEKALKGLYKKQLQKEPPKPHSLTFLIDSLGLEVPQDMYPFIMKLSTVSVPARYPEQLLEMQKVYNRKKTESLLKQSKEVLEWLRNQL